MSTRDSSDPAPLAEVLGRWGSADLHAPHVVLLKEGKMRGSDGCNRMSGEWERAGGQVVFGAIATTRRYCEGVDTSLNRMRTARPSSRGLQFYDVDGRLLATLPHVE